MNVFLTGGTGLVGSHVAELLRGDGHPVLCLQRPSSDTTRLCSLGCRIVRGDLGDDPKSLAEAMSGCAGPVHAAALVYPRVPWPEIHAVNVEGTRRILRAARPAGIRRVVHLSSVAVYGDPYREGDPIHRPPGEASIPYARSKREAEVEARQAHETTSLQVCILRPAGVYGERDRGLTPALASLTRLPLTPLLGPGDRTVPIVYAGSVALAVGLALTRPDPGGEVFDVGEDDPITQREALRALGRGMGVDPRFVSIPVGLAESAARLWDALGRRTRGGRGAPTLRLVRLATRGNPFSSSALRKGRILRLPQGYAKGIGQVSRKSRPARHRSTRGVREGTRRCSSLPGCARFCRHAVNRWSQTATRRDRAREGGTRGSGREDSR